jgi:hypothetical protein
MGTERITNDRIENSEEFFAKLGNAGLIRDQRYTGLTLMGGMPMPS